MTPSRRLPTGVLVLITAALLGPGAAWWINSAPAAPPAVDPTGNRVLIQLDNGAMLAYDMGSAISPVYTSQQFNGLAGLIDTQWPCRVEQPGFRSRDLRGGYDTTPAEGARVIQLPRCAASLNTGR